MRCPCCGFELVQDSVTPEVWRFPRIDLRENTIIYQGKTLVVRPQVAEALVPLISKSPRIVSRQEIADAIWGCGKAPPDEFKNIRRCVVRVREALREFDGLVLHTVYARGWWLSIDGEVRKKGRSYADLPAVL